MAPVNPDQALIHEHLQNTLHDLYTILLQTATTPTPTTLSSSLQTLDASLRSVHDLASTSTHPSPGIPETLVHYVENGRNPDIYTREFVELVRRMNQLMRGKMGGFKQFRDVLAREVEGAMPESRDVLASTSTHPSPGIPETLVHYVENGRNPDIYTREFVELVRRMNQLIRGKMGGFKQFRDVLAREVEGAMPECKGGVERVLGGTGGR